MAPPIVRRVRFDFSEPVPLNWQPERPSFGMHCNLITMWAPAFEKFIADATREALPLIKNPEHVAEAKAFLRQEAQHSAAHLKHMSAMVRQWPGLQETVDAVDASYKNLTETKPLKWRLAYVADLESTFTPYFGLFLDHEDKMFRAGDQRIASLFMWHFVEEMEHRASALTVCKAVHDSFIYRLSVIGGIVAHMHELLQVIHQGFAKHIPIDDDGDLVRLIPNGLSLKAIRDARRALKELPRVGPAMFGGVPKKDVAAMLLGLVRSQSPRHDPAHVTVPTFADDWVRRYEHDPTIASRWYTKS